MTLGPLALALALSLSPPAAGRWALLAIGVEPATMDGRRDLGAQLERICWRESRCSSTVGIHVGDAYLSGLAYANGVKAGRIDPACQPNEPGAWASRGPWGLMAGLHIDRLPACAQPFWLDVPLVSALLAARKYVSSQREGCEGQPRPRRRWCKRT